MSVFEMLDNISDNDNMYLGLTRTVIFQSVTEYISASFTLLSHTKNLSEALFKTTLQQSSVNSSSKPSSAPEDITVESVRCIQ